MAERCSVCGALGDARQPIPAHKAWGGTPTAHEVEHAERRMPPPGVTTTATAEHAAPATTSSTLDDEKE